MKNSRVAILILTLLYSLPSPAIRGENFPSRDCGSTQLDKIFKSVDKNLNMSKATFKRTCEFYEVTEGVCYDLALRHFLSKTAPLKVGSTVLYQNHVGQVRGMTANNKNIAIEFNYRPGELESYPIEKLAKSVESIQGFTPKDTVIRKSWWGSTLGTIQYAFENGMVAVIFENQEDKSFVLNTSELEHR
jgi:hypothetical protein